MKKLTKGIMRRGIVAILAVILCLMLAACGSAGKKAEGADGTGAQKGTEYVYVPEFISLRSEENDNMDRILLTGEKLYYSVYIYEEETGEMRRELNYRQFDDMDTKVTLPVGFEPEEGYQAVLGDFFFDAEESLYTVWHTYPIYVEGKEYDDSDNAVYLLKYDSEGNQVWMQEISAAMTDENNRYIQKALVGKSGKIYATSGEVIYVFDGEGNFVKTIQTGSDWIENMVATEDGRIFITRYGMNGMELVEIDTQKDVCGNTLGNLPEYSGCMKGGKDGKLWIAGSGRLFSYDTATQESTEILNWIDCNIDGNYVQDVEALEDGRIAVFYDNYTDDPELTILTRTESSKVEQKQVLTLATLYEGNSGLQQEVVAFNKMNKEYQIKIRSYIDNSAEWTETTYSDGIARLNADIVSNDGPDIIDLSALNLADLAAKGALEDLTPYLESSTVANRKDFVPSVLEAYQYDGVQVTVPLYFNLITLLAKSSLVGEESGWTLDDVMALSDANPDALLMQYVTKESALELCMQFTGGAFVDYETGKCNFDSPEFKKVLEFANRFGEETSYEESLPSMIQSDKVLLSNVSFGNVQEYQMYQLMFEDETTSIGYPTVDGSAGIFLSGYRMYGISGNSDQKEGAWQFVEGILSEGGEESSWQFPSRTKELEQVFIEAMRPEYQYDETGAVMKDEEGNPIEVPKTTWGYDDWDAEIYAATQKEIDEIGEMIKLARPVSLGDAVIYDMIAEDATAYFEGQKSVEEVVKIIQSRVQIYVNEKR